MAVSVVMPKLGNTSESAIILAWWKQVGDTVDAGDVLAEIETDKAIQEVTSTSAGVLLEMLYAALEDMFFPQASWIIDAIHERILPLEGHTITTEQGIDALRRRHKAGV